MGIKFLNSVILSPLSVLPKVEVKIKLPAYVVEKESDLRGSVDVK